MKFFAATLLFAAAVAASPVPEDLFGFRAYSTQDCTGNYEAWAVEQGTKPGNYGGNFKQYRQGILMDRTDNTCYLRLYTGSNQSGTEVSFFTNHPNPAVCETTSNDLGFLSFQIACD